MTSFIVVCAVMLAAAVSLVAFPLMRTVPTQVKGQPAAPRANLTALTLLLALPLAAAGFYAGLSNFPWKNPQSVAAGENPHGDGSAASMAEVTRQLEARLKDNPNDAEGWRMLGRTYLVSGMPAKAVTAYEKAQAALGAKDPGLELDIAEALVLTDDPAVQGRAQEIVDAALAADATNQKALWYSGVLAYKADHKETAKKQWLKLLELNPPDEVRQVLVTQLTALGAQLPASATAAPAPESAPAMGGGPMMAAGGTSAPEPQGRTIRVAVSVDPSLASKLQPGVPLFVAARQPGIPGPPLAAVRLTADALPTTVVLSDANAMIEGRNLSSVDDVEIVARVAFGGTVATSSGDLVGTAIQKKGESPDLKVVIAKVQP